MSSLLSTASVWDSNETGASSRKRIPTMNASFRKTVKNRSSSGGDGPADYSAEENPLIMNAGNSQAPMSMADLQSYNQSKQTRVNEMLNRITQVNADNVGSKLADFVPLSAPSSNTRKPGIADSGLYAGNQQHELLPKSSPGGARTSGDPRGALQEERGGLFVPNETSLGKYTNYRAAHDPTSLSRGSAAPYYAKMGIGKSGSPDDRMMEKINYMIHLLEEQQLDKTNNITEEFILYTLLGVFVIYIVDSFSRAGKYMR